MWLVYLHDLAGLFGSLQGIGLFQFVPGRGAQVFASMPAVRGLPRSQFSGTALAPAARSTQAQSARAGAPRARVEICSRPELVRLRHWRHAFADKHKDHRYYEVVEKTIRQGFEYRYFVIKNADGEVRGVQPFFLLDQDLLGGLDPRMRNPIELVRRAWPRFMMMRTLMVGCAAGEGQLDGENEWAAKENAALLASVIGTWARKLEAGLVVLKEFPAASRKPLEIFRRAGFARIPSFPMVRLRLAYDNFDTYMKDRLGKNTRRKLRKKFREVERGPAIEMSLVEDIAPVIDEVYPLYLQVFERSQFRFEKLSKDYFLSLGRRMPDKMRFFVWRRERRIVAFAMCMVHKDTIYFEYVGLDYRVAFDAHLYHLVIRDLLDWAMARRLKWCVSTSGNYDPKYHMRFMLDPLDLYVRHTSGLLNAVLKLLLPLAAPVRCLPILKQFPNYADLWETSGGQPSKGRALDAIVRDSAAPQGTRA